MEDPITKRPQPRDYIRTLENRISQLESALSETTNASPGAQTSANIPIDHVDPSQDSGTARFAESLATLGLKAGGNEHRYLGQSSGFSFSRIISSSLLKSAPFSNDDPRIHSSENDSQQFPSLLPDLTSAKALSDAYFRSIQQQYPFLHEPTIRAWEAELLEPGKEFGQQHHVPLFFLYAVRNPCSGWTLLIHSGIRNCRNTTTT